MRVEISVLLAGVLLMAGCSGVGLSSDLNSIEDLKTTIRLPITTPPTAPATSPVASTPSEVVAPGFTIEQMLAMHNATRTSRGLAPLKLNSRLSDAAHAQAAHCAKIGTLTHTGTGGSTVGDRASAAGYSWKIVGENLAMSTQPSRIYDLWLGSRGHTNNIVEPRYTEVGFAAVSRSGREYWCAVFATR